MDERTLVKRARRGDEQALVALLRMHERAMLAMAAGVLDSRADAPDAVQEAYVEVFRHIRELRDPERFRPWLSQIVINKCRGIHRRSGRLVLVESLPEPEGAASPQVPGEYDDLLDAVRSLPAAQRDVVALRYFCDMRLSDVAEVLGCPLGTVKSRLNRALDGLEEALCPDPSKGSAAQEVAR